MFPGPLWELPLPVGPIHLSVAIAAAHATITIIAITNVIIAPLLLKILSMVLPAVSHATKNMILIVCIFCPFYD